MENSTNFQVEHFTVKHPLRTRRNQTISAPFVYTKHVNEEIKHVYIVEMATVCGLESIEISERNPFHTTTYELGLLLDHILKRHSKDDHVNILLGVGGSCTNDAGIGCLQAMGCIKDITLKESNGVKLLEGEFYGSDLVTVDTFSINRNALPFQFKNFCIDIACDVTNPFVGPNGAVHTFSKQKGAKTEEQRYMLEEGMKHVASIFKRECSIDVSNEPGCGAAGGIR